MKIREWFGYNEYASPYALRPGELQALVNLQPRKKGMIGTRLGLTKIYGDYSGNRIVAMYRQDTRFGEPDVLYVMQTSTFPVEPPEDGDWAVDPGPMAPATEVRWVINRLSGETLQSETIDQRPLSPDGVTQLTDCSFAEDRHGRLFIFYGHGVKPRMYRPTTVSTTSVEMGLAAPQSPPEVEPTGEGYFISRVDVTSEGGAYWGPPTITVAGGSPERPAQLKAVVQGGALVAVDVVDGGFNFKQFPSIQVGTDKTGVGFLGVGIVSTDPGLQGFTDKLAYTLPTLPQHAGSLADTETFADSDTLTACKVMYLGSDISSLTTWTSSANPTATATISFSATEYPTEARVGDLVSMSPRPTGMTLGHTRHRVVAVDPANRTVTLSKTFTATASTQYQVLFRRPLEVRTASLAYDATAGAFIGVVPLETITGAGQGAEATLALQSASATKKLGSVTPPSGWVAHTDQDSGVTWATKRVAWNTYTDNYWNGVAGSPASAAGLNQYAGVQAHGRRSVLGFVDKLTLGEGSSAQAKPTGVWFADYSHVRVWLNTGLRSDDLSEHTAVDVPVQGAASGAPFIEVELRPTIKSRSAALLRRSQYSTAVQHWQRAANFRFPKVRIYLRHAPDVWSVGGDKSLPPQRKNSRGSRIQWWSPTSGVPRPIVDFQGAAAPVDGGTVDVVDAGAGWEPGTTFSFKILQANAYSRVTQPAQTGGFGPNPPTYTRTGHQGFPARYQAFLFRANANDNLGASGPPNVFGQASLQRVDRGGTGYRTGDIASVSLLRRTVGQTGEDITHTFSGYITNDGLSSEWTGGASTQSAAAVIRSLSGSLPAGQQFNALKCSGSGVLYPYSPVHATNGADLTLQIATYPLNASAVTAGTGQATSGSNDVTGLPAGLSVGDKVTALSGEPLGEAERTVTAVVDAGNGTFTATLSGAQAAGTGSVTLRRVYTFSIDRAIRPAPTPTWTAVNIQNGGGGNRVVGVRIVNAGRNYQSPPTLLVRGGENGYGLKVEASVDGGRVTSVRVIDPGADYTAASPPEIYTSSDAAAAVPVMRPHLRGMYQCAYRYADRSETVVGNATVTAIDATAPTKVTLNSTEGIKPEMILDSAVLPFMAKVKGVQGNVVTLTQEADSAKFATATAAQKAVLVRDMTKPVSYSDFSPIAEVNAGPSDTREHANEILWNLSGAEPPERADMVEFYRTSADQALVFYRLEMYGVPTANGIEVVGRDTMTDEELFDSDRPNYAAVPVVLPNGNVNAYRFGQPRSDMAVCAAFRDRLWYGVSTSGKDSNTLFFSEYDEFESCPDVNELPIQNNQRTTDSLTAIIPFGSLLLAMQHKHCYGVTYNTDPGVDATIQMLAHRGCLNKRCWDIHQNTLYAADESGVYAMARSGEVQSLSDNIGSLFDEEILNFANRDSFFLSVCERTGILRLFCSTASDPTDTPSMALCYSVGAQTWWVEQYPNSITAAVVGRPTPQRSNCTLYGGTDGNIYELLNQSDISNDGLLRVEITEHGTGYLRSPDITALSANGSYIKGVVSEGRLVDAIVHAPGWGAYWGAVLTTEAGESLVTPEEELLAAIDYAPFPLEVGPPDIAGGVQATALAHFSRPWRVARQCAVDDPSQPILKVLPATVQQDFTGVEVLALTTEAGETLIAEVTLATLTTEPWFIEPGMEVFGGNIPLGTYVDFLAGDEVHLRDAFGNPVLPAPATVLPGIPQVPAGFTYIAPNVTSRNSDGRIHCFGVPLSFWGQPVSLASLNNVSQVAVGATYEDGRPTFLPKATLFNNIVGRWYCTSDWQFLTVSTPGYLTPGTEAFRNLEEKLGLDLDGNGLIRQTVEVTFYKPFRTAIPFRLATGALQMANEDSVPQNGDRLLDRSVAIVYSPTEADRYVELIEYFNEDSTPSPNIHRRSRGGPGAFEHRQDSASTVLNISRYASSLGRATGVAKATFASRVLTDPTAENQHVRIELVGRPQPANTGYLITDPAPTPVILHSLTIDGVVEEGG